MSNEWMAWNVCRWITWMFSFLVAFVSFPFEYLQMSLRFLLHLNCWARLFCSFLVFNDYCGWIGGYLWIWKGCWSGISELLEGLSSKLYDDRCAIEYERVSSNDTEENSFQDVPYLDGSKGFHQQFTIKITLHKIALLQEQRASKSKHGGRKNRSSLLHCNFEWIKGITRACTRTIKK